MAAVPEFAWAAHIPGIGIFVFCGKLRAFRAEVAKLADAPDLGSGGEILRGSSPLPGIVEVEMYSFASNLRTSVTILGRAG